MAAYLSIQAQFTSVAILDYNGISATISASGLLFNDPTSFTPGFEYPKGSGKNMIYAMGDWYAGINVNAQLTMAASEGQIYSPIEIGDFSPGPLTVLAGTGNPLEYGPATTDVSTMLNWNNVWVVRKAEIDSFIEWHTNAPNWPGYVIPSSILDWPAHDNLVGNLPFYLAPFIDTDSNQIYNPNNGDYPEIKGDFCAFTLYNDKGHVHQTSGANPIGIEIHQMVYGYITDSTCLFHEVLDAVLFVDRRIINRSTNTLTNFSMGIFVDPDLGNSSDDYIGCDVGRSMMYVYNGDSLDEGPFGYGSNIPAMGVVILEGILQESTGIDDMVGVGTNQSINGFGFGNGIIDDEKLGLTAFTYLNGSNGITTPNTSADRYNLMSGNYTNGSPFMDPDGTTKFIYPDDTNPLGYLQGGMLYSPWEEEGASNLPGDRKMLAISGDNMFGPGEYYDVTLAVVAGPLKPGGIGSVEALQYRVDSIKSVYGLFNPCSSVGFKDEELNKTNIYLYPNPSNRILNIEGITPKTEISIYNIFGSLVITASNKKSINVEGLKSGIYLIQIKDKGRLTIKRFIKE